MGEVVESRAGVGLEWGWSGVPCGFLGWVYAEGKKAEKVSLGLPVCLSYPPKLGKKKQVLTRFS